LEDAKQLISESLHANLNPNRLPNMRRSGVVLWGAPGCGKTLIAKGNLIKVRSFKRLFQPWPMNLK
jgi:ATP-dependent 26S proteasome regulatory subunit